MPQSRKSPSPTTYTPKTTSPGQRLRTSSTRMEAPTTTPWLSFRADIEAPWTASTSPATTPTLRQLSLDETISDGLGSIFARPEPIDFNSAVVPPRLERQNATLGPISWLQQTKSNSSRTPLPGSPRNSSSDTTTSSPSPRSTTIPRQNTSANSRANPSHTFQQRLINGLVTFLER